jgi:hypothetical protein
MCRMTHCPPRETGTVRCVRVLRTASGRLNLSSGQDQRQIQSWSLSLRLCRARTRRLAEQAERNAAAPTRQGCSGFRSARCATRSTSTMPTEKSCPNREGTEVECLAHLPDIARKHRRVESRTVLAGWQLGDFVAHEIFQRGTEVFSAA